MNRAFDYADLGDMEPMSATEQSKTIGGLQKSPPLPKELQGYQVVGVKEWEGTYLWEGKKKAVKANYKEWTFASNSGAPYRSWTYIGTGCKLWIKSKPTKKG